MKIQKCIYFGNIKRPNFGVFGIKRKEFEDLLENEIKGRDDRRDLEEIFSMDLYEALKTFLVMKHGGLSLEELGLAAFGDDFDAVLSYSDYVFCTSEETEEFVFVKEAADRAHRVMTHS